MSQTLSFIVGVVLCFFFMNSFNGDMKELFETAYNTGKQDGYVLGRNDATLEDFPFKQLEYKCMFLYDHLGR